MTTKLKTANQKSIYPIIISYNYPIKTLKWSLTDTDNNIINSRDEVNIPTPGVEEMVILSGDDLNIFDTETDETKKGKRIFTTEATFDHATFGNDKPINDEASFTVLDLVAIES
ncbi:MAG: hypothetical protein KAR20_10300 [Candidatus Heimdallarchaeota archaeon]|nr:hypothetical protein [Candidatus Heimdallarchaeota archaeon]